MKYYSLYNVGYNAGHVNLFFKHKEDAEKYAEYLIAKTGDHHKVVTSDGIGFDYMRYGVRYPENPLDFPKEENPSVIYSCGVHIGICIMILGETFSRERAEEYARDYILKEYGEKELHRMRVNEYPFYNELPFTVEYKKIGNDTYARYHWKR